VTHISRFVGELQLGQALVKLPDMVVDVANL
jgi:hypothetical protein